MKVFMNLENSACQPPFCKLSQIEKINLMITGKVNSSEL